MPSDTATRVTSSFGGQAHGRAHASSSGGPAQASRRNSLAQEPGKTFSDIEAENREFWQDLRNDSEEVKTNLALNYAGETDRGTGTVSNPLKSHLWKHGMPDFVSWATVDQLVSKSRKESDTPKNRHED